MKGFNFSWDPAKPSKKSLLPDDGLVQSEIQPLSHDTPPPLPVENLKSPTWKSCRGLSRLFHGWRYTVSLCSILTFSILLVNITILLWSVSTFKSTGDSVTVSSGECGHIRAMSTWLHLGINILSSALLGASNYCMQCLTSPTREAIDAAHGRRKCLNVGVPNFRNLLWVGWEKALLWGLLALSSVPLHLLWNSVIFEEIAANNYVTFLMTEGFVHGPVGNFDSPAKIGTGYPTELLRMQSNITALKNMTNEECIQTYTSSPYIADYGNVVLITHDTNDTHSFLAESYNEITMTSIYYWACHDLTAMGDCNPSTLLQHPSSWVPGFYGIGQNETVKYCLAERRNPPCHLGISPRILLVVVVCNVVKLLCFLFTLYLGTSTRSIPLVTTGDVISSFVKIPDPHTRGRALLTKHLVRKSRTLAFFSPSYPTHPIQHTSPSLRWFHAASLPRWLACLIPSTILIVVPVILLKATSFALQKQPWLLTASGFGKPRPDMIILPENPALWNIASASLVANTPQLLLSYTYLAYNGLFTCMLAAQEYTSFATKRRGLRVTAPIKGSKQRSRYYLHLPYRYGIPLLAGAALLHWLVSQSIFLLRVIAYDEDGNVKPSDEMSAVGYSPLAIVISASVGSVLLLAVITLGFFCRFDGRMPLPGGCSAVIAAACQPATASEDCDGETAAEKALQWGVVSVYDAGEGAGEHREQRELRDPIGIAGENLAGCGVSDIGDGEGLIKDRVVMHATFSAEEVGGLEKGGWYA